MILNSFVIALCSTLLACALGLAAALAIRAFAPSHRGSVVLLGLSALPILVPNYVIVSFWLEALSANGWLSRILAEGHAMPVNGLAPAIVVLSLIAWSPVALVCYYTLTRIDRAMIEAAELALGKWRTNLRVVVPLLAPSLTASAAFVFVLTFCNFSVPALFQIETIQNAIYTQFNARFDIGQTFLFALPQIGAMIVVLGGLIILLRRRTWIVVAPRPAAGSAVGKSSPSHVARVATALFLGGLILLSSIGPLLRAVGSIFRTRILWETLSVSTHQIWNSFWFSFLTATIATIVAFVFSTVGGVRKRDPRRFNALRSALNMLFLIPFVLPEVLIGVALIAVFNRPSLQFIYTSVAIIVIALTVRYFIVAKLAVSTGVRHLDPSLLEAAELAGLPRSALMLQIHLPLLGRWLFAGWWLTYLFCLADVGSLVLIYPPGCDTVPIRIFNLLHYGYDAQVSVLCLVMLLLGALPLVLLPRVKRDSAHD